MNKCTKLIDSINRNDSRAVDELLFSDRLNERHLWQAREYIENDLEHPLIVAIEQCNSKRITRVLQVILKYDLMINESFEYGYRPIDAAVRTGNVQLIETLIDHGAEVQWAFDKDKVRDGALSFAVLNMRRIPPSNVLTVIEVLVSRGCNINPTDAPSPLHYAMSSRAEEELRIRVIEKLIELGADVNHIGFVLNYGPYPFYTQYGTPLHAYNSRSGVKAVSLLLDNGADISLRNSHGLDVIEFFQTYMELSPSDSTVINEILRIIYDRFPNQSHAKKLALKPGARSEWKNKQYKTATASDPDELQIYKVIAGLAGSILGAYISAGIGLLAAAIVMLIVGVLLIPIAFFIDGIYDYVEAILMLLCSIFIILGAIIGFTSALDAAKGRHGGAVTIVIALSAIALVVVTALLDLSGIVLEPFKSWLSWF